MNSIKLNRAALVLIDLQKGIVSRTTEPHTTNVVLTHAKSLASRFRAGRAPVVQVHVHFAADFADALRQPVDSPMQRPPGGFPADFAEFADGLVEAGDLIVTKRQWGAFYGTDLDLQLRRRGVGAIVLGGIATNFGVESTARDAWERGYEIIFAEDAMTSVAEGMHRFSVESIFPRIGRVASTAAILDALS
jgi:nicotinamidase-related amidase